MNKAVKTDAKIWLNKTYSENVEKTWIVYRHDVKGRSIFKELQEDSPL